jgi:thioredoxin 1
MPILIIFGAPWSPPVRIFAPIIKAVANEYAGRVKVGEVNVDENAKLAKKFDIKGIPTLVIIKNGSERERVVGITSKESIGRLLDKQLDSNP